ncbi:MAG TPA: hypothetical protein PKH77_06155 [Anaerolineae bacterium]|nr:hypothetical protein [Anaerolineae bacterium]
MTEFVVEDTTPLEALTRAQQTTFAALSEIDEETLRKLTQLTLPEIRKIRQEVAEVLPAGNLPAMILSGLTQLKGRKLKAERVRQDVSALMRGLNLLPQGLFSLFVAGPATVLYAYQKLLRLAGKDLASAFPQGMWQFYLEFGLREDQARHANETTGFQKAFPQIESPVKEAAAWACAALDLLYRYNDLLAVDWRERVMLRVLLEVAGEVGAADAPLLKTLTRDWNRARPYRCPSGHTDYLRSRLETFELFLNERLECLPEAVRAQVQARYTKRQQAELPAYVEQMSLLAALTPEQYQEVKKPIPLWRAYLGFVWKGQTHLFPVCERNAEGSPLCYLPEADLAPIPLYAHAEGLCDAQGNLLESDGAGRLWYREGKRLLGQLHPAPPETVYGWVAAVLSSNATATLSDLDLQLAACPRTLQWPIRAALPKPTQAEFERLRRAPILLNWDASSHRQPLAYIRRGRRGIGDHALTLFRTDKSMVFDQSHIFFDGMWGVAVAEIVTNSAMDWYQRWGASNSLPPATALRAPLALQSSEKAMALLAKAPRIAEVSAEADGVDVERIARLRRRLSERGVALTVNDLLLLYRIIHAAQYTLSASMERALTALQRRVKSAQCKAARAAIDQTLTRFRETNPALLIPMDASNVSPRERLYPATLRNPLPDLPPAYQATHDAYHQYLQAHGATEWQAFDQQRRRFLAHLKVFSEFQDAVKAVTMRGESFNTATLRLLGHLPPAMQHVLDQIPQRIGVLNEVIKGNEVFSNVGRVTSGSSLRRFLSAKDDGEAKELVWAVLTDDHDRMHITLRDFRPFVKLLLDMGESDLANALAQDYLDSYVQGLNRFIAGLYTYVMAEEPVS